MDPKEEVARDVAELIMPVFGQGSTLAAVLSHLPNKISIDFCGIFFKFQKHLVHVALIDKEGHDI